MSKLEVNRVKFIYGGLCDGKLYFEARIWRNLNVTLMQLALLLTLVFAIM